MRVCCIHSAWVCADVHRNVRDNLINQNLIIKLMLNQQQHNLIFILPITIYLN